MANKSYSLDELNSLAEDKSRLFKDSETGLVLGACEKTQFVVKDGEFYPIAWLPPTSDYPNVESAGSPYPVAYLPVERYKTLSQKCKPEEDAILVVRKSDGDKLVTFAVADEFYFLSYLGGTYVDQERHQGSGRPQTAETLLKELFGDVEEIDGVPVAGDLDKVKSILDSKGITIESPNPEHSGIAPSLCCKEPCSITVGKYEGTKYVEEPIGVINWVPRYGEPKYYAPTTRTREGYFEINYSNVPAGIYSFAGGLIRIEDSGTASSDGVKTTVDSYSWSELKAIADKISASPNRETALEVAAKYHLCNDDGTLDGSQFKTLQLTDGTSVQAQIVGIYHDDKTSGGKAGLSFLLRDCVAESGLADGGNAGGWESCALRMWLNNDALIWLPEDLVSALTPVNKLTNNVGGQNTDSSSVTITSDKLWIPSCVELFGIKGEEECAALDAEGFQYELYSGKRVNWSGDASIDKKLLGKDGQSVLGGKANIWWTRSPYNFNSKYWYRVTNGRPSWDSGSFELGIAFGFCL